MARRLSARQKVKIERAMAADRRKDARRGIVQGSTKDKRIDKRVISKAKR